MRLGVGAPVLLTLTLCWLVVGIFCQDPTDIDHGCYFDDPIRAMTDIFACTEATDICQSSCTMDNYCESDSIMTIEFCRTLCWARNLRYYGLEAGNQCFCAGDLAAPFRYGPVTDSSQCRYPCSGNSNQTCGGEYKVHIYEFAEPVGNSVCFHPGFVREAFVSDDDTFLVGGTINFICRPLHAVIGDAELQCQSDGTWMPNALPTCNYTGVPEETTTAPSTTEAMETTTAEPLTVIMEYLPYIIGGAVAAAVLLVLFCAICIYCRRKRSRSGGAGQDIRLKPDTAPVTFINAGYHGDDPESGGVKPDLLATAPATVYSPATDNRRYEKRVSTFSENPLYENGEAARADRMRPEEEAGMKIAFPQLEYENVEDNLYANAPPAGDPASPGLSSDSAPAFYPTTGARRAKKNATGTKDLVGWSRPSSLYQRTVLDHDQDTDTDESNEDNTTINAQELTQAIYAQVDKTRKSQSQENLTSDFSANDSFMDPTKTSATPL